MEDGQEELVLKGYCGKMTAGSWLTTAKLTWISGKDLTVGNITLGCNVTKVICNA
jgi:hypothetical protein